jgi:hypothetical protein
MMDYASVNVLVIGSERDIADFARNALTERNGKFELDFEKIEPKPEILRGLGRGAIQLQLSVHEVELALQVLVRKPIPGKFGVGPHVDSLESDEAKKLMLKTYDDLECWVREYCPLALEQAAKCQVAQAKTGFYFEEDWEADHWGGDAKRIMFTKAELSRKRYKSRFDFPWVAPRPIFHAIARDYPSLVIRADAHERHSRYAYVLNASKGVVWEDWPQQNDAG